MWLHHQVMRELMQKATPIQSLARLGGRTLGIDASSSNIAIASLHASQDPRLSGSPTSSNVSSQSLEYKHTTSEELLAFEGKRAQFDVVCSMEVLEHVDHPDKFLRSCADLVKVSLCIGKAVPRWMTDVLLSEPKSQEVISSYPPYLARPFPNS